MTARLTTTERDEVETCEYCDQPFDVSLPDSDEHRYTCEDVRCQAVVCHDCRSMDVHGNDWCPDCSDDPAREWAVTA